ncbi:diaminopimelate decarboxylase [Brevibacterium renqingii]|uniref:diaminopimelate decarboxylase n=1 Tax=Brevibacterium renqingii TaxID=2776916 RepID=UPI001ADED406|nr:diaminopimelate decarboxylase [Brevibacterium renqingii]
MPSSHHSIPDSRARAIRAIAETSNAAGDGDADGFEPGGRPPDGFEPEPAARACVPVLTDRTPVLGLMDLDGLSAAFERLNAAFVSQRDVLHAVACKAVPVRALLHRYAEAGAGCEVASSGELELALAAGFTPERIVFDSPAKTWTELRRAVDLGVSINVDNFEELARLDALLGERRRGHSAGAGQSDPASARSEVPGSAPTGSEVPSPASARIGIRINPQSGTGAIGALSTATETSKFGIGLADPDAREKLIEAYLARPWLNQIHVHSGSQGISLDRAAVGVRAAVDLAQEINARAASDSDASDPTTLSDARAVSDRRRITRIDIGGGLSVNFEGEDVTPTFAEYRAVLEEQVPELFDFDIVTEFGRALLAKAGTILTRVEYAKTTGGRRIAMTQAGVQVATRTAYAPADWPLRILPFTADGEPKTAEATPTDVAGPACFSGDLLARDRMLPRLDAGDLVAVPETGAYYFSNPFSYNLLPRVPVYGYCAAGASTVEGAVGAGSEGTAQQSEVTVPQSAGAATRNGGLAPQFFLIRRGQSIDDVLAEAGGPELQSLNTLTEQSLNTPTEQGSI